MSKEKSTEDSTEDKLWILGINYGYFWEPTLDHEPEEDRLNREAFLQQILSVIDSEKVKAAKCSGCGKDSSYCANCERLLQT